MRAAVGIGSNLGDRLSYLRKGVHELLSLPKSWSFQWSSIYQTNAIGRETDPPYLNACVTFNTSLEPTLLLNLLLTIESRNGRTRSYLNAPRTLDLDLLLLGNQTILTKELIVPHPRMHERLFVLTPLNEIEGKFIHPIFKKEIRILRNSLLAQENEEDLVVKTDLKLRV